MPTDPIRPWRLITTRAAYEAPPSRWHGIAGFSPNTNRIRYAVVPLNVLLWFAQQIWFLVYHPEHIWAFLWRDKSADRLRRVEAELDRATRVCHRHRLIWTGEYFLTYEQAEAEAKARSENPPRTLGPPPCDYYGNAKTKPRLPGPVYQRDDQPPPPPQPPRNVEDGGPEPTHSDFVALRRENEQMSANMARMHAEAKQAEINRDCDIARALEPHIKAGMRLLAERDAARADAESLAAAGKQLLPYLMRETSPEPSIEYAHYHASKALRTALFEHERITVNQS